MASEIEMAVVVNMGRGKPYDVRIDRKTKLGNPFGTARANSASRNTSGICGSRSRCEAITLEDLADLDGKRLGCWCGPRPCHGNVIARAAQSARRRLGR